ncbi:MAG TPA: EthD domain-containing protein [Lacipirellulaceae bacterium]|nr:EthD domain-containing protein [Lacipirellulaceae bacterium]
MKKVVCLLKRRDGLSFEAFKDYYENNHVKIFAEFLQTPGVRRYVRRYLTPLSNPVSGATAASGFDVIMEVWIDNEQLYQGFVGGNMDPKVRAVVIADEEKLFDRSQMFFHVVDEHDSRLPNGVETYGSLVS